MIPGSMRRDTLTPMGALRALVAAGGCATVLAITATPAVAAPTVGCQQAPTGVGRLELKPQRDVVIGPVVIRFATHTVGKRRNAWGGVGYKLPLSLSAGATAVVSVPPRLRNRVRLVYNQPAQRRVERRGVRGGSKTVRFEACPGAEGSYSSWSGGIAVTGRRCASLRVRVAGQPAISGRVPLGRSCPSDD